MRRFYLLAAMAAGCTLLHADCQSAPCISSLQSGYTDGPASYGAVITAASPTPDFSLYINGLFDAGNDSSVQFGVTWTGPGAPQGQSLEVFRISANQLGADVPASLYAVAGSATVTVTEYFDEGSATSDPATFTINPPLAALPLASGKVGQAYSQPLASGGTGPYYLQYISGTVPPGMNPPYQATQNNTNISGTPTVGGDYSFAIRIADEWQNAITPTYALSIASLPPPPPPPPPVPLVITTTSPLPPATAGASYTTGFSASGGNNQSYSFSVANGTLPAGLTLGEGGLLTGTPTTTGTYRFTVEVTDASNNTTSKTFVLPVSPGALTITTPPFSSMPVGTPLNVTLTAQGGAPQYTFSNSGTLPPGALLTAAGALTATLNTPGSYAFTITVTDSAGSKASQAYTITVTGTALSLVTTSPLAQGQAGVAYSAVQFQAQGGVRPYTWAATSVPPGMSFSADGVLSGTPAAGGSYSIGVTVTDSAKAAANGSFALTIAGLAITTASLPNGMVGTPYSAPDLTATGGSGALTWSATGLPAGITLNSAGAFSGTPGSSGAATVVVTVQDASGHTASKSYTLTVTAAALSIVPTGSIPTATVGSSFTLAFTTSGGVQPYSYTASGLPAGLVVSSSTGSISGSPTAAGNSSVTVTVKDSTGATASTTFALNPALPSTPPLSFTGISSSLNPGSQSSLGVSIGAAFPVDVTVKLTLTFTAADPAVQFSTGGTTASLTIPAGQTASASSVGVQTGTVAGTITVTAQLTAGGADITPSPAPSRTIIIPTTAPAISSITAVRNSTGLTVTIVGYSSTLALSSANFTFNGTNLATSSFTVAVNSIFAGWYGSSAAGQFGSNFTYTQPFTVSDPQAVTSVTVTLTNGVGASSSATANLQ